MKPRRSLSFLGLLVAAHLMSVSAVSAGDQHATILAAKRNVESHLRPTAAQFAKLPLAFEPNGGQTDARVKFLARAQGYMLFLSPTESTLVLNQRQGARAAVLRLKLVGANSKADSVGLDELPGRSSYFIGSDAPKWRTNIPHYAKARFENVYPGVDLVYYGNEGRVEHDFIVAPTTDPDLIRLEIEGAETVELDAVGDGVIRFAGGELHLRKPVVYQEIAGERREVDGRFVRRGRTGLRFDVGNYDLKRPLVIDPVLAFSTYLGGTDEDAISQNGLAVDSAGNAWLVGASRSPNFPTTPGTFDTSAPLDRDIFVARFDAQGALVFSTFLGSSGDDEGGGVAVDSTGSVYVTGAVVGSDFPITAGAFQTIHGGSSDAFVCKLDPTGSTLAFSTYLGGGDVENGYDTVVDSAGNVYVTGRTRSANFPTTPTAFQTLYGGGEDGFVAKLDSSGSALIYSTFLGGNGEDIVPSVAIDSSGFAYVAGATKSANFPTTLGSFQTTYLGSQDGFVAKLNPNGSGLSYSTYLGSNGQDMANSVVINAGGDAYVSGLTASGAFPVTVGAYQTAYGGGPYDAFVAKLDSTASALLFSTFLGGSGLDVGMPLELDASGAIYVTGWTTSSNFPVLNPIQATNAGSQDGFVLKLNPTGTGILFSTYLGGSAFDNTIGIGLDAGGGVYVAGNAQSSDFPTTVGSSQPSFGGPVLDVFLTKIAPNTPTGSGISVQPIDTTSGTQPVTMTFTNVIEAGDTSLTTTGTGAPPPSGFLLGSPPTYFEISTTAIFSGPVEVCIDYSAISFHNEAKLKLFHREGGSWVDVTASLNTTTNIICGLVSSFSSFAVFQENQAPTANAGADQTVACTSPSGTAVMLDGTASHDPDESPLTYSWTGPFFEGGGTIGSVSPTVTLPLGTSTINLVVNDGIRDSAPDMLVVAVVVGVQGLESPLALLVPDGNSPQLPQHAFKQGRTLPLKLQISCGGVPLTNADTAAPRIVGLLRNGDALDISTIDLDAGQANDSGVLFRFEDGSWVYNLSTRGLSTGTYTITIEMPDGQRYTAGFVLR